VSRLYLMLALDLGDMSGRDFEEFRADVRAYVSARASKSGARLVGGTERPALTRGKRNRSLGAKREP
jgi:hypothetical protein